MYNAGELTYELPINMQKEWSHLFKPDFEFKKINLGIKEIKNAFVNHYGLVIKNGLLVKGCAPNIGLSTYDEGFYYTHWRKAIEQFIVSKYGKSIPSIRLDDNNKYLLIHSPWFSYYFWITECIPRLLKVKKNHSELILIYPENWKKISFVNETLALFDNLQIKVIPQDHHIFVRNLVMPEVKPWTPMFIPELVFETRNFLFEALEKQNKKSDFGKNIYISRKNAARRKFTNEDLAEKTFEKYGFETVSMEDFSFFDQIAIMQNATNITALTGAGLINILFKKEQGSFLDLTNKEYIHKSQYKFHYYKLCNILNIKYGVTFYEHENSLLVDHYSNQNLIFDTQKTIKNLNLLVK